MSDATADEPDDSGLPPPVTGPDRNYSAFDLELTHQAGHDPLTELPNRREFGRRLGLGPS